MLEGLTKIPLSEEVIALLFEHEGLLFIIDRFAGLDFDVSNGWKTQKIICPVTWSLQLRKMFQFVPIDSLLDILIIIVELAA